MALSRCSSEKGIKFDQEKLKFHLLPVEALLYVVTIYTGGSFKYDERNWEKGMKWSRVYGALQRHSWLFWGGESKDPESGLYHMGHVAWNSLALLQYEIMGLGLDDRPKNSKLSEVMTDINMNLKKWKKRVEKENK